MKPLERVQAVLQGESVDRLPFCLYPHYDLEILGGDVLAQTVAAFVERTETDVVVVPSCFQYTPDHNLSLDRPTDLGKLEVVHGRHGDWSHQQDAIRTTCVRFFGKRPVVAAVPSAFLQLERLAGKRLVREAMQESPGFFGQALQTLNQSLCAFIKMAVETGVSGILVEEPAASHELMTPAVYKEKLFPLLQSQLQAAKPAWTVVQFQGKRLFWEDLTGISCEGLGWPITSGPNLVKGALRWRGFTWGGLDPTPWADASVAWLRGSLPQKLSEIPARPLLLAPPCGLSGLRLDQVEALARGLRRLPSPERLRETPAERDARRAATPPKPRTHKEAREPFVPPVRSAPQPEKGARTRLHGKSTPAEPLSPPDTDLLPPHNQIG